MLVKRGLTQRRVCWDRGDDDGRTEGVQQGERRAFPPSRHNGRQPVKAGVVSLRQCVAFFCVLPGFHRFQTHHAIHPSYARWLDAALCGQTESGTFGLPEFTWDLTLATASTWKNKLLCCFINDNVHGGRCLGNSNSTKLRQQRGSTLAR